MPRRERPVPEIRTHPATALRVRTMYDGRILLQKTAESCHKNASTPRIDQIRRSFPKDDLDLSARIILDLLYDPAHSSPHAAV